MLNNSAHYNQIMPIEVRPFLRVLGIVEIELDVSSCYPGLQRRLFSSRQAARTVELSKAKTMIAISSSNIFLNLTLNIPPHYDL